MVKASLTLQLTVAVVSLGLAVYLATYLFEKAAPLTCSTGVPCPQDCDKCPVS